jgi:hypothetical protein
LSGAMQIGEGVQLMHQPFRMYPAQGMLADGELSGVIAQQHGIAQEAMRVDAAPLSPLGGDLRSILDDRQTSRWGRDDAKPGQMRPPHRLISETGLTRFGQTCDQGGGQSAAAPVAERRLVQHVVGMPGTQQIQEVQPALG